MLVKKMHVCNYVFPLFVLQAETLFFSLILLKHKLLSERANKCTLTETATHKWIFSITPFFEYSSVIGVFI